MTLFTLVPTGTLNTTAVLYVVVTKSEDVCAATTKSYVVSPAGLDRGQKIKVPSEALKPETCTRSILFESGCSRRTRAPPIGLLLWSTIVPLMELLFVEISPACRTGFRRYFPLPSRTIEAQESKPMSRSEL